MANIFGERIRTRLRQLRRTQRWLQNQTGIQEQIISNIINDRYDNPGSIKHAVPMAKAMNTTVDFLFGMTKYAEKPIYPSPTVRRLATLAERLPLKDQEQLLEEIRKRVEATAQAEPEYDELRSAMLLLVERFGGVEAALAALDVVATGPDEPADIAAEDGDLPLLQYLEAQGC